MLEMGFEFLGDVVVHFPGIVPMNNRADGVEALERVRRRAERYPLHLVMQRGHHLIIRCLSVQLSITRFTLTSHSRSSSVDMFGTNNVTLPMM